ncbi:apoptosis facilitator Bcl-2-like protein 14 [Bombina bombina]|uniref:apoptosis facilitator Bcl-2-like protein 14 n=1 Tax=Bombina bombina TaxID=8345 RepID=UPI00235AC0C0|nr:apoptosis facilitator Bcl-2-like protein 14 [Bombina bombina]
MVSVNENSMDEVPLCDDDTNSIEYRLLMAYAQRTLPASKYQQLQKQEIFSPGPNGTKEGQESGNVVTSNGKKTPAASEGSSSKKKPKKSWKKSLMPACLRPESETKSKKKKVKGDADTNRTTAIVQRLQSIIHKHRESANASYRGLVRSLSLETDGEDDEGKLIQDIAMILRNAGDNLEKEKQEEATLWQRASSAFNYSFYERVINCYLSDVVIENEPETQQQCEKLALCIDVTTKLTAIDNHPMNKVLGFGARYLQDHFSSWIQNEGGWGKAMGIKDEEIE